MAFGVGLVPAKSSSAAHSSVGLNSAILIGMDDNLPKRRWFCPTPGWLVVVLLGVEALLFLVERYYWLPKGWPVLIAIAAVALIMLLVLLWFVIALILRWRFQFSIRSLLALVFVVAVPFSWLAVEMKQANSQPRMVMEIERLGGNLARLAAISAWAVASLAVAVLVLDFGFGPAVEAKHSSLCGGRSLRWS